MLEKIPVIIFPVVAVILVLLSAIRIVFADSYLTGTDGYYYALLLQNGWSLASAGEYSLTVLVQLFFKLLCGNDVLAIKLASLFFIFAGAMAAWLLFHRIGKNPLRAFFFTLAFFVLSSTIFLYSGFSDNFASLVCFLFFTHQLTRMPARSALPLAVILGVFCIFCHTVGIILVGMPVFFMIGEKLKNRFAEKKWVLLLYAGSVFLMVIILCFLFGFPQSSRFEGTPLLSRLAIFSNASVPLLERGEFLLLTLCSIGIPALFFFLNKGKRKDPIALSFVVLVFFLANPFWPSRFDQIGFRFMVLSPAFIWVVISFMLSDFSMSSRKLRTILFMGFSIVLICYYALIQGYYRNYRHYQDYSKIEIIGERLKEAAPGPLRVVTPMSESYFLKWKFGFSTYHFVPENITGWYRLLILPGSLDRNEPGRTEMLSDLIYRDMAQIMSETRMTVFGKKKPLVLASDCILIPEKVFGEYLSRDPMKVPKALVSMNPTKKRPVFIKY